MPGAAIFATCDTTSNHHPARRSAFGQSANSLGDTQAPRGRSSIPSAMPSGSFLLRCQNTLAGPRHRRDLRHDIERQPRLHPSIRAGQPANTRGDTQSPMGRRLMRCHVNSSPALRHDDQPERAGRVHNEPRETSQEAFRRHGILDTPRLAAFPTGASHHSNVNNARTARSAGRARAGGLPTPGDFGSRQRRVRRPARPATLGDPGPVGPRAWARRVPRPDSRGGSPREGTPNPARDRTRRDHARGPTGPGAPNIRNTSEEGATLAPHRTRDRPYPTERWATGTVSVVASVVTDEVLSRDGRGGGPGSSSMTSPTTPARARPDAQISRESSHGDRAFWSGWIRGARAPSNQSLVDQIWLTTTGNPAHRGGL